MTKQAARDKDGTHENIHDYVLCLYITGATPNSVRAVANLSVICEQYLAGRYSLKIIDVYQEPDVAEKEQLVALPMLIIKSPLPEKRLIGDLSNTTKVLESLLLNS